MPLHPQARRFLNELAAQNAPGWETMPAPQARRLFAQRSAWFGESLPVGEVVDRGVAGGVPIRVYTPKGDAPFPVMVYFHGGGWVLGDLSTHDALCRRFCQAARCVVVSVDYRRAPESRFPAAVDDAFAAMRYVADHGDTFAVDPMRIVVAGDSAGGNLAAAVALRSRDSGGPAIRLQLLLYPVLHCRFDTNSYREYAEGFGLTQVTMQWFWRQYLASDAEADHPYASPLAADDLSKLPPAHVVTAECDVLRDEGEAFARRLVEAGGTASIRRYDGMIHGFMHLAGVFDDGRRAIDECGIVVRKAFDC